MTRAALGEYHWLCAPAAAVSMLYKRRLGFDNEAWSGLGTVPGAMAAFGLRLVIASGSTAWVSESRRGELERRYRAVGIRMAVNRQVPPWLGLRLLSGPRHSACSGALVTWILLPVLLPVHGRRSIGLSETRKSRAYSAVANGSIGRIRWASGANGC
jgi:hypothetical protein